MAALRDANDSSFAVAGDISPSDHPARGCGHKIEPIASLAAPTAVDREAARIGPQADRETTVGRAAGARFRPGVDLAREWRRPPGVRGALPQVPGQAGAVPRQTRAASAARRR